MTSAYCTSQDVIELCSWLAFGRFTDAAQNRFIRAASGKIDEHCRRRYGFAERYVTETFDGRGQPSLQLSLRPVKTIAVVTVDGDDLDNSNADAWHFDLETGELGRGDGREDPRFAERWPVGVGNIAVQYWGGYSADDMPDQLVLATALLVRHYVELGRMTGGVFATESIGDWSGTLATMAGPIPVHVAGLLTDFVQDEAFV